MDSSAASSAVSSDVELGKKLGLQGTPTFFVNGKALVGPQIYQTFEDSIKK